MQVRLVPIIPGQEASARAAASAAPGFDTVSEHVDAVIAGQSKLYGRTCPEPPWIGYLAFDTMDGNVVGSCSFISHEGAIEIAYFTFPPFEGRGYATAMAGALVDLAMRQAEPPRLLAFTLSAPGPSSRILEGLGFNRAGTSIDHEAGEVWAWEKIPGNGAASRHHSTAVD